MSILFIWFVLSLLRKRIYSQSYFFTIVTSIINLTYNHLLCLFFLFLLMQTMVENNTQKAQMLLKNCLINCISSPISWKKCLNGVTK